MSDKTMQRAVKSLLDGPEPLIVDRARHSYNGATPRREAFVYALTDAGHARIRSDPAYPLKTSRAQYPAKVSGPATMQRLEHERYRSDPPTVLWVAPTHTRLEQIHVA